MEKVKIHNIAQEVSRIALGTWAIGGWMWGGSDENTSIAAVVKALNLGINIIDTAPVYGFGVSEQIVGKALKKFGKRDSIVIATKAGLKWKDGKIFRDSSKKSIILEVEDSLKRLQTPYIDIYQIHWPDTTTAFSETAEALLHLQKQGKIRALGLSNFSVPMMQSFQQFAKIDTLQSPYNLFEREIEKNELPFAKRNEITLLAYGPLCRGLLAGKMHKGMSFSGDDLRKIDPKFQEPHFSQYLACIEELKKWVEQKYQKPLLALAMRWLLDKGADVILWGARKPEQLDQINTVENWQLNEQDFNEIDAILDRTIQKQIGPEFMAPPSSKEKVHH